MIKLFAWESHALGNIEKYRDQELHEIRWSRLLRTLLGAFNEIIPIIAKIVVITLYVIISFVRVSQTLISLFQILISKEHFRGISCLYD